ncbi:MAG TPA: hypothetical protein VJ995_00375 [Geothermobacteraceae bacterium]|nr:hypothetical protein [Geothermobacteraceae bacterium]
MAIQLLKQVEGIETVGQLRAALEGIPDEKSFTDVFGEPVCLTWCRLEETGEELIEIT